MITVYKYTGGKSIDLNYNEKKKKKTNIQRIKYRLYHCIVISQYRIL